MYTRTNGLLRYACVCVCVVMISSSMQYHFVYYYYFFLLWPFYYPLQSGIYWMFDLNFEPSLYISGDSLIFKVFSNRYWCYWVARVFDCYNTIINDISYTEMFSSMHLPVYLIEHYDTIFIYLLTQPATTNFAYISSLHKHIGFYGIFKNQNVDICIYVWK